MLLFQIAAKTFITETDARDIGFVEKKKITDFKSTAGCGAALLSGVIDGFNSK